jgi:hypothetical protein
MIKVSNTEKIRRYDTQIFGRLMMLPSTTTLESMQSWIDSGSADTILSIDFPAMPDTLELARTADYIVQYSLPMPDGVHQYKGTAPFQIPVSFKLHAEDPFCEKGSLTLLKIAARLHAFILPISTRKGTISEAVVKDADPATPRGQATQQKSDVPMELRGENAIQYQVMNQHDGVAKVYPPGTCWLHLIYINESMPGISCVGYVKDVKAVLAGPWRISEDGGFNLPSSGEFSFTFVHRPGHGNNMGGFTDSAKSAVTQTPQAFAADVLDNLYNTHGLTRSASTAGWKSVMD